jgi:hypothetical protein
MDIGRTINPSIIVLAVTELPETVPITKTLSPTLMLATVDGVEEATPLAGAFIILAELTSTEYVVVAEPIDFPTTVREVPDTSVTVPRIPPAPIGVVEPISPMRLAHGVEVPMRPPSGGVDEAFAGVP